MSGENQLGIRPPRTSCWRRRTRDGVFLGLIGAIAIATRSGFCVARSLCNLFIDRRNLLTILGANEERTGVWLGAAIGMTCGHVPGASTA
jgi:hypothetical protein